MTGGAEPLARLAGLFGIETVYEDAFQTRRQVPEESVRALLGAMGCPAASAGEVLDSLRTVERETWQALLEPVLVRPAGELREIPVTVPDAALGSTLSWRIAPSSGEPVSGRVLLGRLRPRERAEVDGRRFVRLAVPVTAPLPAGEHRLEIEIGGARGPHSVAATTLIGVPERCFGLEDQGMTRLWGLTAQLYALRSGRNFGGGDFTDLAELAELGARRGAAAIGINPLHALFPAEPRHISPYSPSNRLYLNPLYLDLEAVPELALAPEAQARLADPGFRRRVEAARASELVDYEALSALKMPLLEVLHRGFREVGDSGRRRAFEVWRAEMGESLDRQARFDALHEHHLKDGIWSWRAWPEPLRDPAGPAVRRFAEAHEDRVDFFAYVQWLADQQLGAAQARAQAAGMPLGLYRDLAVAVHPDGAMAWGNPGVTVTGASVGAPPDQFNPRGQNWGLAPMSPAGLRAQAYRLFAEDLRQNMRHAGALRIDHVMGLMRLFWIPDGGAPEDGAYVSYPLQDLTGIIALQSQRERCLVIGEDLGTVAPGFREGMADAGIMSYRVLYFERDRKGNFRKPERYPEQALICLSTHDLPTLAGFWTARDIAWRHDLGLYPEPAAERAALAERRLDRAKLITLLERAGVLRAPIDPETAASLPDDLVLAACRLLASAPSALMMVQLEDVLGEVEQANLPGTTDQHPNWRRKLPLALEDLSEHPVLTAIGRLMTPAGRDSRHG